ncbi:hypothetical protein C8Q77DRAFT_450131 [Trametes polyzona]|nr:hypothetical protein C8Q77DRAFT_450131 [Trametes polyzona]
METSNLGFQRRSPVSRVIGTPELLRLILDTLDTRPNRLSEDYDEAQREHRLFAPGQTALARCTLVSRYFSEIALDVLWRVLYDLYKLLSVLDSRQVRGRKGSRKKPYTDRPDIDVSQWTRFQKYAARVRCLGYNFNGGSSSPYLSAAVIRTQSLGRTLLPNLEFLHLDIHNFDGSRDGLARLPPLLSPRIQGVAISMSPAHRTQDDASLVIFETLCNALPHLTTLCWDELSTSFRPMHNFGRFHELKNLTISSYIAEGLSVDLSSIVALSTIQPLQHLSIPLNRLTATDLERLPGRLDASAAFKHLRSLSLSRAPVSIATRFVQQIRATDIEELLIELNDSNDVDISIYSASIQELCGHLPRSLRTFSMMGMYSERHAAATTSYELSEFLWPLLSFNSLQAVRIEGRLPHSAVSTSDDSLAVLAAAWPGLRTLLINPTDLLARSSHTPLCIQPSVRGLVAFAERCPLLTSLTLPALDISSPIPPDIASVLVLDRPLRYLAFNLVLYRSNDDETEGTSYAEEGALADYYDDFYAWSDEEDDTRRSRPVPTPTPLAAFLDRLFPQLEEVCVRGDEESRGLHMRGMGYCIGLGNAVTKILRAMHRGREYDRIRTAKWAAGLVVRP